MIPTLSIDDGLLIQQDQLNKWAEFLNPKTHARLVQKVKEATENTQLNTGFDVPRGTIIEHILLNEVAIVI